MQELGLGELITKPQNKDAIHVAVAPVTAAMRLSPGEHVGIIGDKIGRCDKPIGIVDPFLKTRVLPDEQFWLFLYPNTVTSLRHEWTHPGFSAKGDVGSPSKNWIRSYADSIGVTYDELMEGASEFVTHDEYLCQGKRFRGVYLNDNFWPHYQVVTGETVPEEKQQSFFSCSC